MLSLYRPQQIWLNFSAICYRICTVINVLGFPLIFSKPFIYVQLLTEFFKKGNPHQKSNPGTESSSPALCNSLVQIINFTFVLKAKK